MVGTAAPVIGLAAAVVDNQFDSGILPDTVVRLHKRDKKRRRKLITTYYVNMLILLAILLAQGAALYQAFRAWLKGVT